MEFLADHSLIWFHRCRKLTFEFLDTTPVRLMDVGFVVMCASPTTVGLASGSCSSARIFASRFFRAPPRGECDFTLTLRYHFTSITL